MSLDLLEQLRSLENELARLEDLLARDENYKALQQLNSRESQGNRVRAIDDQKLRANLEASLSSSRIYQARGRLLEVIALLKAEMPDEPVAVAEPAPVGERQVVVEPVAAPAPEPEESVEPEAEVSLPPVAAATAAVAGAAAVLAPWQESDVEEQQTSVGVEPQPVSEPDPSPAAVQNETEPQRLHLIKGIDSQLSMRLSEAGITSFAQIADWQKGDIARINSAFNLNGAIVRDGWIEQAAALAKGTETVYARGYTRDESQFIVAPPLLAGRAVDPTLAALLKSMSAAIVSAPILANDDDVAIVAEAEAPVPIVEAETPPSPSANVPRPPAPLLGDRVFVPARPGSLENLPASKGAGADRVLPPPLPISEALFEGLPGSEAGIVRAEPAPPMQFQLPEDEKESDAGTETEAPAVQSLDLDDEAEVTIVSRLGDASAVVTRSARPSITGKAAREPAVNRFKAPAIGGAAVGSVATGAVEAQVDIVRHDVSTNESDVPVEVPEPSSVASAAENDTREAAETVLPADAVSAAPATIVDEPGEPVREPEPIHSEPEPVEREAEPAAVPRPAFVKRPPVQEEAEVHEPQAQIAAEPAPVPRDISDVDIDVDGAEVAIEPRAAAPEPVEMPVAPVAVEKSGGERKSKRLLRALTGE